MMSSRERNTRSREEGAPCETVAKYMVELSHSVTWKLDQDAYRTCNSKEGFEKDPEE